MESLIWVVWVWVVTEELLFSCWLDSTHWSGIEEYEGDVTPWAVDAFT